MIDPPDPERGRRRVVADLIAGVTVACVLIPQSLAYAELAGMPPVRGLYAAALPPILAALLASSPWLQTGPVALTSLLTFGALSTLAVPGSDAYVGLAAVLAGIVGVVRIGIGLLHAGAVTYLMSHPVLRGFTQGAAIVIVASQIPAVLGVAGTGAGVFPDAIDAIVHPGSWSLGALGFALFTWVAMIGGRRIHPLFPGLLVAVVVAVGFSAWIGYTGDRVGAIAVGLPDLSLELPFEALPHLLVPGVIIALVGFAEAASISQTFAERERVAWDPNREFMSQGLANLGSAIAGAFPVGGSFSRSALNHMAGARTRLAGAVTGLAVLATLPFASVLQVLPKAVLGMAVIGAVLSLIRPTQLLELWRLSPIQAAIGTFTFVLTIALTPRIELAVVIGIGLSIAVHLWREKEQRVDAHFEDGVLTVRPGGVMWFGSAPGFRRGIADELAKREGVRRIIVDLSGLGRLDLSGALLLREALHGAASGGTEVALCRVPPQVRRIIASVCPEMEVHEPPLPEPVIWVAGQPVKRGRYDPDLWMGEGI